MGDSTGTPEKTDVRCADCGLLSLRDGRAASPKQRNAWVDPRNQPGIVAVPRCLADAFTPDDNRTIAQQRMDMMPDVVGAQRTCAYFVRLVPGRDPAWHQDQVMFAEIQKRDEERKEADRKARLEDRADERKWQLEQKAGEHQWQLEQKEADRKARLEDRADERKWQLQQKWKDRIFAIVLAVAGFFLGYFSRDKPNEAKPEIKMDKKTEHAEPKE